MTDFHIRRRSAFASTSRRYVRFTSQRVSPLVDVVVELYAGIRNPTKAGRYLPQARTPYGKPARLTKVPPTRAAIASHDEPWALPIIHYRYPPPFPDGQ